MPGPDHEEHAEEGQQAAPEVTASPSPAAPHWRSLVRMDASAATDTPGQREMLSRLQRTAGNARIARLLGEVAPPELRAARQASDGGEKTQAPGGTLLVADEVGDAGPGRMGVGAFLDAVEAEVTEVAAKELGPVFEVVGWP